jgi:hypothetical protein
MSLSDQAPVSVKDIPERVLEMSIVMSFVLFAPWSTCSSSRGGNHAHQFEFEECAVHEIISASSEG